MQRSNPPHQWIISLCDLGKSHAEDCFVHADCGYSSLVIGVGKLLLGDHRGELRAS